MQIEAYKKHDRFLVAVDCIIFGFDGKDLKALLVKREFEPGKGKWSLMGGFAKLDESIDEAANRVLNQLTGLSSMHMEQLYCFGDTHRDPGGRVLSIAFFALIKIDDYKKELMREHQAKWFSLSRVPDLVFDHREMIQLAKQRLRSRVARKPIGFALLPDKFTLQQLQALYEAVYERGLDNRNFTKKILSIGVLEKLTEKEKHSSKKGAFYYIFNKKKYEKLDKEEVDFI